MLMWEENLDMLVFVVGYEDLAAGEIEKWIFLQRNWRYL